jgi:hypothetical protein
MKKVLIILVLLVSVNSYADDFQSDGHHTHDGFFFRALLGGGTASTTYTSPNSTEYEFSGSASLSILQIGGAISENLILFFELSSHGMIDPDVEVNGSTTSSQNMEMSVSSSGIGLSYYIMPANVYLSGSLALGTSNVETDTSKGSTENGFATNLIIGKEWWVSKNWGIGVAAIYHYSKMNDQKDASGEAGDVKNNYYGIAFSATYN